MSAQPASCSVDDRRRRSDDPARAARERARAAAGMRQTRRRQAATGKSFAELRAATGCDEHELAHLLADELRAGRVEYRAASRRFALVVAAFDSDIVAALAKLTPAATA